MTDTTVAPAAASPAAALETPTETPVNPNPPSSPNPVGAQAPPVPDRPPTRREALKAAFDRATAMQDGKASEAKPAKKADAAVAKPGHNRPPEPVEAEKPRLSLKKRPADQDASTLETQPRGERGRFAPRAQTPSAEAMGSVHAEDKIGTPEKSSARTLPDNAPFREPPARMAEHAKADWATAPESVRGEVHRMHAEFGSAYNQLKPAYDAFQPIARFHQMATEHGTTLERALHNYTSMEAKLREDVIGGLDVIINNLGLKTPDGRPLDLRDISYHVLSQTPEQLRLLQQGNSQTAASAQIGALYNEFRGLKEQMQQWQTGLQFSYTRAQVDTFADSHPRFDELGAQVEQELRLGFDLETAYRRAELLQPATHAPQTRTPAAQTRAADRSISGSPGMTGSAPAAPRRSGNGNPPGRRESIANAIKRVNGAV